MHIDLSKNKKSLVQKSSVVNSNNTFTSVCFQKLTCLKIMPLKYESYTHKYEIGRADMLHILKICQSYNRQVDIVS